MELSSQDELTQIAFSKGIKYWSELLEQVRYIPYGRNNSRTDLSLVLTENKGTCSSKHALVKTLADLNQIPNVELVLAMYKMNDRNTPGIQLKSLTSELDYIPEAHCYLRINNSSTDLTTVNSSIDRIADDILSETIITSEQVGQFKIDYHREYLKRWHAENEIEMCIDALWNIRE